MGTPVSLGFTGGAGSSAAVALTASANIVSGDLILVFVGSNGGSGVSSIADSGLSNTYQKAVSRAGAGSGVGTYVEIWYAQGCTAVSSPVINVSFSGTPANRTLAVFRCPGMAQTSALDKTSSAANAASGSTGTLTQASEVAFGFAYGNTNGTLATASGFTNLVQDQTEGVTQSAFYESVSATTALTFTPSTAPNWYCSLIATFLTGGTAYTASITPGSLSVTGVSPLLQRSAHAITTIGTYSITGASPLLKRSAHLISAIGSYAISGVSPTMYKLKLFATTAGSYAITGVSPLLHRSAHAITTIGAYAITGASPLLKRSAHLISAIGTYAITGASPLLQRSAHLISAIGSYAITGASPIFKKSVHLLAAVGSYAVTGAAIIAFRGRRLNSTPGSYAITGFGPLLVHTVMKVVKKRASAAILYSLRAVKSVIYRL